jgi:hypothetical protein
MPLDDEEFTDRLVKVAERGSYLQRRIRAGEPKSAKEIMATVMSRRSYGRVLTVERFDNALREAVGDMLASFVRVAGLRRGRLDVVVANSAMLQEMTYHRTTILEKMSATLPDEAIRDIRFRIGPVDRGAAGRAEETV